MRTFKLSLIKTTRISCIYLQKEVELISYVCVWGGGVVEKAENSSRVWDVEDDMWPWLGGVRTQRRAQAELSQSLDLWAEAFLRVLVTLET
jgi:hypothetical protein